MLVRRLFAVAGCSLLAVCATPTFAQEADAPAVGVVDVDAAPVDGAKPAATPEQIAEWIKELDHDAFNVRQTAQQKLQDAGASAIEALGEAALSKSQEVGTRAVEVLKTHAQSDDDALKTSAKSALEKIAKSDNPIAARRAEAALQTAPKTPAETTPADQNVRPVPFGGGGIRIDGGGIRIGGGGAIRIEARTVVGGGKGKSITVKNVDGNKEITVEEEGRKVKIEESAAGKIKMSVTEKVDGKEETKSYEAESADDLKKVQPEAHKIYEQYKDGGIGGRIEFKAAPAPARIGAIPVLPVPAIEVVPAERLEKLKEAQKRLEAQRQRLDAELPKAEPRDKNDTSAVQQLDDALKQLEAAQKQLESAAADGKAEAIKQAIDGLQAAKKQLEAAKATLKE